MTRDSCDELHGGPLFVEAGGGKQVGQNIRVQEIGKYCRVGYGNKLRECGYRPLPHDRPRVGEQRCEYIQWGRRIAKSRYVIRESADQD